MVSSCLTGTGVGSAGSGVDVGAGVGGAIVAVVVWQPANRISARRRMAFLSARNLGDDTVFSSLDDMYVIADRRYCNQSQ